MKRVLLVLALSTSLWGQTPPTTPTLSATTQIALQSLTEQMRKINEEQQALQRAFAAIDGDVRKQFPGWHLSPQTFGIEKDAPTPKPEEKK